MNEEKIELSTGYTPRKHQALLHRVDKRFKVIVAHRGFGKSIYAINEILDSGLRNLNKNPRYIYCAPNYAQAKRIAWDILKDYTHKLPGFNPNEADLKVDLHRPHLDDKITIMLLGAEKPGSLKGIHVDGVVLDEYSEMDPIVWKEALRPTIAIKKGFATFIGTPKGRNHFHDVYRTAQNSDKWYSGLFRASDTGVVDDEELELARETMSDEEYSQEYECSFEAGIVGAYFVKQMQDAEAQGRITDLPYDPALPVDTWWDLGVSDTTAIWFSQNYGSWHHMIDYMESSGVGLDHYARELQRKTYVYGEHNIPHDGAAVSMESGRTRQETLMDLGIRTYVHKRHPKIDQINASRMMIPKCKFDKIKCEKGLEGLRNYVQKWDSRNKIFSAKPLHNWASNPADAFHVFSMNAKQERMDRRKLVDQCDNQFDIFNF